MKILGFELGRRARRQDDDAGPLRTAVDHEHETMGLILAVLEARLATRPGPWWEADGAGGEMTQGAVHFGGLRGLVKITRRPGGEPGRLDFSVERTVSRA